MVNDPGYWQHYLHRVENKHLTVEQVRQKFLRESLQYQEWLIQLNRQPCGPAGPSNVSSVPTPITLAFEISSESGTNVLLQIGTKVGKSVDVTVEWDAVGLVPAGSISETIAANTTWSPSIDLETGDTNVPFRIILSDASAIQLLTWTASNDDTTANEYQIWTTPTNFSALTGTNTIQFEFQGVSELDISNFEGAQFSWVNDATITSANLTNVNANTVSFQDCTSLSTLTLTGLTYGNSEGGHQFNFYNCVLDQASVIGLLTAADASGYENGLIDVSNLGGSGNYAPNGAEELAIVASLEAKGWEMHVNGD